LAAIFGVFRHANKLWRGLWGKSMFAQLNRSAWMRIFRYNRDRMGYRARRRWRRDRGEDDLIIVGGNNDVRVNRSPIMEEGNRSNPGCEIFKRERFMIME
jgi:hypothetical protein